MGVSIYWVDTRYNILIKEGGTREKVEGQANALKVECEWKISSVHAVDRLFDELLCWLIMISVNGLGHGYISSMCLHGRGNLVNDTGRINILGSAYMQR